MPAATRKGDQCTGHDACPPVPLVEHSPDVNINGRGAGRVGDHYAAHGCVAHPGHQDVIAAGSSTVFINKKHHALHQFQHFAGFDAQAGGQGNGQGDLLIACP